MNTLGAHLESISSPACRFSIHKVQRDRVSIRSDYVVGDKKKHAEVLLVAYPTGSEDDAPCNNLNVVLDPVGFVDVETCAEREIFAPLFGHDLLDYYEKMHPHAEMSFRRCC